MNPTAAAPLLTGDEFLRLHGDDKRVELVDGQLVRHPMPGMEHGVVCSTANFLVSAFVRAHRLGWVVGNDSFIRTRSSPDRYRGADVAFVSYAKLPKERGAPKGPLPVPPDLVIEVRSPSDRIGDMTDKAIEYVKAGVTVAIVLDPDTESLAVFRADEFPVRMHNGDELTLPDVLPGFVVQVKDFFG